MTQRSGAEPDWRLLLVARIILQNGDFVVRVGDALGELFDKGAANIGVGGTVLTIDAHAGLDARLDPVVRPTLIATGGTGREAEVLAHARQTLLRWRPFVLTHADAEAAFLAGETLHAQHRALRAAGYVVRAIRRFGLRPVDTSIYADPCHWVAAPCERVEVLERMSSRILWRQLWPWPAVNPVSRAA